MDEWEIVKLGDILNFRRGHDLPKTEMKTGIIPVVASNGIIGYHNKCTTKKPCITIGRSGNVGTPYYYNSDCWAHNTTLYIDDYKGNSPKYIYYLLKTLNLKTYSGGSAVPTLNRNHIHPLEIFYTKDILEQKAIAKTLSCLDDKIDLNNHINQKLEEMAQALFKQWFIDFEFPDENGLPYKSSGGKMVDSEMGEIPEGWRVGSLGEITNIIMGQSPKGSSYNENNIGEIFYQGRTEFGWRFPRIRLYTSQPKRMANKNSILLSVRAPVGDINITTEKCCIGRGVASISSKPNYNTFVFYLLKNLKSEFDMYNGEGTVFGSINKDTLFSIKVVIPNNKVLSNFGNLVEKNDYLIYNNFIETQTLTTLRDTLLPKLMSGKVQVPIGKI